MHLLNTVASLLAGVIVLLSTQAVEAAPLSKRDTKFVTLPLKRAFGDSKPDVHPQILLQQHINLARRRLARMVGRSAPSSDELLQELHRRVASIEGDEGLERRFNRYGLPPRESNGLEKRFNRIHVPARKQGPAGSVLAAGKGKGTAVAVANSPTGNNSLGLDIEAQDVGYLAKVQMGTPPREFLLLMDSGSADLWVGGENCQSENGGGCGKHIFLGEQSSSTFQDSQDPFQVTYGTGQVEGTIVQDNIVVAGLSLEGHTFGVATSESVDFSSNTTPFDGLMGLGQSTLSEQQTLTPVEALAKAGLISDAVVSYKISRLADGKNDGEITFGGLDDTKFDPKTLVSLDNVNDKGFWESALDAITVDGKDSGLQSRTAILDTGTTLIIAPPADAAAVHKLISGSKPDGQGGFTIPCGTTAQVALTFGGQSFTIDPRDILVQPVDPTDPKGDCVSGIAGGDTGGGATEWLVGDVFLKNAYFSTDVTKNTLSLAALV